MFGWIFTIMSFIVIVVGIGLAIHEAKKAGKLGVKLTDNAVGGVIIGIVAMTIGLLIFSITIGVSSAIRGKDAARLLAFKNVCNSNLSDVERAKQTRDLLGIALVSKRSENSDYYVTLQSGRIDAEAEFKVSKEVYDFFEFTKPPAPPTYEELQKKVAELEKQKTTQPAK